MRYIIYSTRPKLIQENDPQRSIFLPDLFKRKSSGFARRRIAAKIRPVSALPLLHTAHSMTFKAHIDNIPDFPTKGVVFRDISPLLAGHFPAVTRALADLFTTAELAEIDGFAGVDSRGFIFAAAMATLTNKNFIMPRKAGKLPHPYVEAEYALEYGTAKLHLKPGHGKVIIVDDVLATGGTLNATAQLCTDAGYDVKGFAVLIDLKFLNDFEWNGLRPRALMTYETP